MEGSTGASAIPAALTTTAAAPAAASSTATATAAPVAEAIPRAAWRAALDEEKLPRLDADVEAWLDALPTSDLHFKDTVPRIERLLREEDYHTLKAVTKALLSSRTVRAGLREKTLEYFDENLKNAKIGTVASKRESWKESPSMLSDTPLRSEGVDLRSSSTLLRPALCKVVANKLSEFGVTLFRAPPQSGKTSLGSLMAHHVSRSYVAVTAYYCNFFRSDMQNEVKRDAAYQSWGKCCKQWDPTLCGWSFDVVATFSEIFAKESTQDVLLVIDEAQHLYAYPNAQLWADIKSCQQPSSRVRVLLLAAYSLENIIGIHGTPIQVSQRATVTLEETLLHRMEQEQLRINILREQVLPKVIWRRVRHLAGGHIGALSALLLIINGKSNDAAFDLLLSSKLSLTLAHSFRSMRLQESDKAALRDCLEKLLFAWGGVSSDDFKTPNDGNSLLARLVKSGLVTESSDYSKIMLAAPFLHITLHAALLPAVQQRRDSYNDPMDLVVALVGALSPPILTKSLSRSLSDGSLLERAFQMEFYRALNEVAPKYTAVSPDFGRVSGSAGYVDFFLNGSLKWAFEITRGKDIKAHLDRFGPNGIYSPLLGSAIREWRIVDFVGKPPKRRHDNVIYVVYNQDYSQWTVLSKNRSERVILQS